MTTHYQHLSPLTMLLSRHTRRREFITLLVTAAATLPLRAHAQAKQMRRIGVLMGLVAGDPEAQSRVVAFENGLRELGWVNGRNLWIEYRWAGDGNVLRDHVAGPRWVSPLQSVARPMAPRR